MKRGSHEIHGGISKLRMSVQGREANCARRTVFFIELDLIDGS